MFFPYFILAMLNAAATVLLHHELPLLAAFNAALCVGLSIIAICERLERR